ncbi:MAG: hypothetical protein WA691_02890 [Thermoplasmata archaeon]
MMESRGQARIRARRAHLCACSDPTAHQDLRASLGTSYLAVRRGTFRAVLGLLRKTSAVVKRLEGDNVRLARENARLRSSLKKTLDISVDSPVFEGGLGGRTAIESYRKNAGRLVEVMNEAGNRALIHGEDAAKFFLKGPFKLDLEALWAASPATEEEGRRRDDLRHKLSVEEELDLLARTDEVGERCRQDFIAAVAGSGIDTSVQELVRRSGEIAHGSPGRGGSDD